MKLFLFCFALLVAVVDCSAVDNPAVQRKMTIRFKHVIGENVLVLGDTYINCLGDTISVQRFKYYLSNFSVTDNKGNTTAIPDTYFLVDEADSASKTITLTIPDVVVGSIGFIIGVDSIKNVSGIQQGALDPLKGMFWTWNSGYVMAKLEGRSSSSRIGGRSFTYHIGGFRQPMNSIRQLLFALPAGAADGSIVLTADINQWFKNKSELKIAETPVCHSPGPLAVRIADNYSNMFTISTAR